MGKSLNRIRYWTKVEPLVALVPFSMLLIPMFLAFQMESGITWANIGTFALLALALSFCWPPNYTLTQSHVVIHFAFFVMRIPYGSIRSIELCEFQQGQLGWANHPQVKIHFKTRSAIISPRERDQFVEDLTARLPR